MANYIYRGGIRGGMGVRSIVDNNCLIAFENCASSIPSAIQCYHSCNDCYQPYTFRSCEMSTAISRAGQCVNDDESRRFAFQMIFVIFSKQKWWHASVDVHASYCDGNGSGDNDDNDDNDAHSNDKFLLLLHRCKDTSIVSIKSDDWILMWFGVLMSFLNGGLQTGGAIGGDFGRMIRGTFHPFLEKISRLVRPVEKSNFTSWREKWHFRSTPPLMFSITKGNFPFRKI